MSPGCLAISAMRQGKRSVMAIRRQHTSLGLRELGDAVEGGPSLTSLPVSLDLIWQLPSKASYQRTIPMLGEIATSSRSTCPDPYLYSRPILSYKTCNFDFYFMLLIFVLTDANEATYSIEFGSNFSL